MTDYRELVNNLAMVGVLKPKADGKSVAKEISFNGKGEILKWGYTPVLKSLKEIDALYEKSADKVKSAMKKKRKERRAAKVDAAVKAGFSKEQAEYLADRR